LQVVVAVLERILVEELVLVVFYVKLIFLYQVLFQ
jgi:hypothetical protein